MAFPSPAVFAKYEKTEMVKALTDYGTGLEVSGNKPDLINRYNAWYRENAHAMPDDEASASAAQVAVQEADVSESVPTKKPRSMLARLLKPNGTAVSAITMECIKQLRYTPGKKFVVKRNEDDLSSTLGSFKDFTAALVQSIGEVQVVIGHGENYSELASRMQDCLGVIPDAPPSLAAYYAGWDIDVPRTSSRNNSRPRNEPGFETQMAMAVQASLAAQGSGSGADDEEASTRVEEAMDEEIDILISAVEHRLTRWSTTFPQKRPEDRLWSSDFTKEEQKNLKKYVRNYLDKNNELWLQKVEQADQVEAVEEMHRNAPEGVHASVIQAIFLDVRNHRLGQCRLSESTASSQQTSRSASLVKGSSPEKGLSPEKDDTQAAVASCLMEGSSPENEGDQV